MNTAKFIKSDALSMGLLACAEAFTKYDSLAGIARMQALAPKPIAMMSAIDAVIKASQPAIPLLQRIDEIKASMPIFALKEALRPQYYSPALDMLRDFRVTGEMLKASTTISDTIRYLTDVSNAMRFSQDVSQIIAKTQILDSNIHSILKMNQFHFNSTTYFKSAAEAIEYATSYLDSDETAEQDTEKLQFNFFVDQLNAATYKILHGDVDLKLLKRIKKILARIYFIYPDKLEDSRSYKALHFWTTILLSVCPMLVSNNQPKVYVYNNNTINFAKPQTKSATDTVVYVREGASVKSKAITKLHPGQIVLLKDSTKAWVNVSYTDDGGKEIDGWVMKKYLMN